MAKAPTTNRINKARSRTERAAISAGLRLTMAAAGAAIGGALTLVITSARGRPA
jgi:hypothetical protein